MSGDNLNLLAYQAGLVAAPLSEQAAEAATDLCVEQRLLRIGDPLPIAFCRREGNVGGCLVSPPATEARFENSATNVLTASWHLVVSEGPIDPIQTRDVFQCACRVGTSTQAYNRRAGSWQPGNVVVNRGGNYTNWDVPRFCGSAGTFEKLHTLSFVNTYADREEWNRQVHVFVRGGLKVTRLIDGVYGPSSNVVDLYRHLLRSVERLPDAMINLDSLKHAARFTELLGMRWDGVLGGDATGNLDDWCENILKPYFLLARTRVRGQEGLMPLLPTNGDGSLFLGTVGPNATLTEQDLDLETWRLEFLSLADRRPVCAQMTWRQQGDGINALARTTEVRFRAPFNAPDGPFEQHDMSWFATSERHVAKVGAFIVAHRALATHTLEVSARPGTYNTSVSDGSIVRVTVPIVVNGQPDATHDYLYRVVNIGKDLAGETKFNLIHLPLDAQGRSAVAVAVYNVEATGTLLTITPTGPVCDVNSSSNETPLGEDVTNWNLPVDNPYGIPIPMDPEEPLQPIPPNPPVPPSPPPGPPPPPYPAPPPPGPSPSPPPDPPPGEPTPPPPGTPTGGPDGPSGPQWGPPGAPVPGVLWDLYFEESLDSYATPGEDETGAIYEFPPGTIAYPAYTMQGAWVNKTIKGVSAWWHVAVGSTTYKPGPSNPNPTVRGMGINYQTEGSSTVGSSSGQGFVGTSPIPVGPWRTIVFSSNIRNFKIRKHGTEDPFMPHPPPPPFQY